MGKPGTILIDDYTYELPGDRIAKYPLASRDHSKILYYNSGEIKSLSFRDVPSLLSRRDQLFFNSTRVVQARIFFRKATGAVIEIFLLRPSDPSDYQLAFSSHRTVEFICLVGNARKWKDEILAMQTDDVSLTAEKLGNEDGKYRIRFFWKNSDKSFAEVLDSVGSTPIPPYLNRSAEKRDMIDYQTVYAKQEGSVAAPTAGLHFSEPVLDLLRAKGIEMSELVLHVGAGTFIPVKEKNAVTHPMHAEFVSVDRKLLASLTNEKRRIAVGTTTTRSLESLYWLGVKILSSGMTDHESLYLDQWEAYERLQDTSLERSIEALRDYMDERGIERLSFQTRLMIVPGYRLRVVSGLFTNFHQPKSTLLLLIAAIAGDDWKKIYSFALENEFRFLSYGDSSLIIP